MATVANGGGEEQWWCYLCANCYPVEVRAMLADPEEGFPAVQFGIMKRETFHESHVRVSRFQS